jgi:hypothetical protein
MAAVNGSSDTAAAARILASYKRAILLGGAKVPIDVARRLGGPDCAYHLYHRTLEPDRSEKRKGRRRA